MALLNARIGCKSKTYKEWISPFTKIVQPRRRRSARKKRPDSQSLWNFVYRRQKIPWRSHVFLKSTSIVFSFQVTTKALGAYTRDLQLIHRNLSRNVSRFSIQKTFKVRCIATTASAASAFLLHHFRPFCTWQAAGRTQGYSVWEATHRKKERNCFEIILIKKN